MRIIKLIVAYDGTNYHGFQRQKNTPNTIQQKLEDGLAKIFGHKLRLSGAGRTDTGVHAQGQVVHFQTTGTIPAPCIAAASRSVLPEDIVVLQAEDANEWFHARKWALSKTYLYRVYQSKEANPFWRNYAWHTSKQLDYDAMREAISLIVGTHDFSSFKASGSAVVDPVRTILSANCVRDDLTAQMPLPGVSGFVVCYDFTFHGTGFLYHMVRNLMGTIMNVGTHKITVSDMAAILAAKDRSKAGKTAPAQGLYLLSVKYPE